MLGKKKSFLGILLIVGLISAVLLTSNNYKSQNASTVKGDVTALTKKCQKNEKCYETSIIKLYSEHGLKYATMYLGLLSQGNGLSFNCHNVAHALGKEAYRTLGDSMLRKSIALCADGFNHGVLNSASENMKVADYPKLFSDFCLLARGLKNGCTHGIGHILAKKETNVTDLQNTCIKIKTLIENKDKQRIEEKYSATSDLAGNCIDGWAMQRIEDMGATFPNDYTDEIFCAGLLSIEKEFCLGEFKRSILWRTFSNDTINQFAKYCLGRSEEKDKLVCGFYVGQSLQENTKEKSVVEVGPLFLEVCEKGESDSYQISCTLGFISRKINYNVKPSENVELCQLLKPKLKDVCLTEITNFKK